MKKLLILFGLIFFVSCSPAFSGVNEQSNSTQMPTFPPTTIVFATNPPVITPTRVPEAKPTPTSVIIPTKYELPNWISDPESTVAMMISNVEKHIYKLSFLNLATRNSSDILVSTDFVRGYFWIPGGKQFGFLSSNSKIIFLVDISNGNVKQYPISERAVRFLNNERAGTIEPLIVYGEFQQDDFFLVSSHQSDFSANLKYRARMDYENAAYPFLIVENLESGSITKITDPLDGIYDYGFSWSPKISYLEVLQGTEISGDMIPSGHKITIYKFDGEKVASFEGNFTDPQWSPDGIKILYKETSSNSPCILEINTGIKKCIREIERSHPDAYDIIKFDWSQSGDKIYYIYYSDSDTMKSGLCVYNLLNGVDFCPTIEVPALKIENVEWYTVSPNEQFFVFSAGNSCAGCDYWGEPSSIVVSSDGKISYSLGKEILVTELYTFSYPMSSLLWRPKVALKP